MIITSMDSSLRQHQIAYQDESMPGESSSAKGTA